MKSRSKSTVHTDHAKNLVRGALSLLRASSVPDAHRDGWKQEQLAQHQINRALAKAKSKLSQKQLVAFEKWVVDSIKEQNRNARRIGTNITSLGLLPNELQPRDLVTELRLAFAHLYEQRVELLEFCKDVKMLGKTIASQDWAAANSLLQNARIRDGYSYWAVETELALKQATEGVESLKSHVTSLSICSIGLNKFFIYFFGVRNEPAQTSSRYKVNLKKRIEDSDISTEMQAYAKYRLYDGLDADQAKLSAVLAYEQLTTTADLLFTLIKIARFILGRKGAFSVEVIDAATQVTTMLAQFTSLLGIESIVPESEVIGMSQDGVHSGFGLMRTAQNAIRMAMQPSDMWSHAETSEELIVKGLASQMSTWSDGLFAEELAKQFLNFSWLPIAIELGDTTAVPLLPNLFKNAEIRDAHEGNLITSIHDALRATVKKLVLNSTSDPISELLPATEAIRAFNERRITEAIDVLSKSEKVSESKVAQDVEMVLLAGYLHDNGDALRCMSLCSKAGMENDRIITMLPLGEMFQGVKWPALRSFAQAVDLPIALDLYLRIIDDRKVKSYKRYAIEELMKANNVGSVVELPNALLSAEVATDKIEYLLCYVCDKATLELLPGMGDSRKVMIARSQVLRGLAALNTNSKLEYLAEAANIENELLVNDGLFALDDSKVYVDEQAILNSVNQELSADFQRYLKLVESGVGVSDSLADVLKSFNNPSSKTFQIPKNDADDLLATIISAVLEKFLFDPASGLDIIIGRRVRHGTIASEIRGYLEASDLIGQKPHAGAAYDAPARVVSLCMRLDPKRRRFVNAAFSRFSESIDQIISLLRDEYFYVRTKTKSRGIFDIQITSIVLALARSIAQTCKTIDHFSKECLEIFWFNLSVHADTIRPTVESEIKKSLNVTFSKLTNELRALEVSEPEFIVCLQQASEELQRRASTIASWIRVPKNSVEGATYSMQRVVDIAVAMVSGQRPGFRPLLTTALPDNLELDMHGFSIVVDAMYIALDNICEHSGKKDGNNVKIEIRFDEVTSLISFVITNEVAANFRNSEKEARINATRLDIQKRKYGERARLNRGSGLYKLAAIVMQSEKTTINFGFVDPNLFRLNFDLVYLGLTNSSSQTQLATGSLFSHLEAGVVDAA